MIPIALNLILALTAHAAVPSAASMIWVVI
jgi:hypothetical protein